MKKGYGLPMNDNNIASRLLNFISSRAVKWWLVAGVVIVTALLFAVYTVKKNRTKKSPVQPTFVVAPGPLKISITEAGVTRNKERAIIRSKVHGRKTIIWIIDEGKEVKEGDLLVELDSSELAESRLERQIDLENGESAMIQARENLAITKNQAEADIEKAELDVKFAEMDLKKYVEGEYPQSLQQADADITIAAEEVQRSDDKLKWSQQLADKGYLTRTELQADELSMKRNQISQQLAKSKKNLLEQYTHTQTLEKTKSELKQAQMALDRVKRKAKANIIQAEANLRAKESEYNQKKKKLDELIEEIGWCRMTAPSSGMVVYAAGSGPFGRSNREPLEIGQEVSERQELMYLPTTDEMIAEISVQETSRAKIVEGMPVVVRVDAMPGQVFPGKISKIGILPDATQAWLNPDLKVYMCQVELDRGHTRIRPGMNCQVEIIIQELEDAMFVPLQSVTKVGKASTVFVRSRGSVRPVTVNTGMDNNRMIHVVSGLNDGDEVLLAPPLEAGVTPANGTRQGGQGKSGKKVKVNGSVKSGGQNEPDGPGKIDAQGKAGGLGVPVTQDKPGRQTRAIESGKAVVTDKPAGQVKTGGQNKTGGRSLEQKK